MLSFPDYADTLRRSGCSGEAVLVQWCCVRPWCWVATALVLGGQGPGAGSSGPWCWMVSVLKNSNTGRTGLKESGDTRFG